MMMMAPGNICTTRKESIIGPFPGKENRLTPYAARRAIARPHNVVPTETIREFTSHVANGLSRRTLSNASHVQDGPVGTPARGGPMIGTLTVPRLLKLLKAVPMTTRRGKMLQIANAIKKAWRSARSTYRIPDPRGRDAAAFAQAASSWSSAPALGGRRVAGCGPPAGPGARTALGPPG